MAVSTVVQIGVNSEELQPHLLGIMPQ